MIYQYVIIELIDLLSIEIYKILDVLLTIRFMDIS